MSKNQSRSAFSETVKPAHVAPKTSSCSKSPFFSLMVAFNFSWAHWALHRRAVERMFLAWLQLWLIYTFVYIKVCIVYFVSFVFTQLPKFTHYFVFKNNYVSFQFFSSGDLLNPMRTLITLTNASVLLVWFYQSLQCIVNTFGLWSGTGKTSVALSSCSAKWWPNICAFV